MAEEFRGRFTGNRAQRLDRVIQQFVNRDENFPNASQEDIRAWMAAGAVEVDGNVKRHEETEVQPGSFIKIKFP